MAEIVVKAKYEDVPQTTLLAMLRLCFPVWGIIFPICAVLATLGWIFFIGLYVYHSTNNFMGDFQPMPSISQLIGLLAITMATFTIPVVAAYVMRTLAKNYLLVEKKGIVFPIESYNLFNRNRFLPWSKIAKIKVDSQPGQTDWRGRTVLFFSNDGKLLKLQLHYYKGDEVEQFLVALETWGSQIEMDTSVAALHTDLRQEQNKALGQSYTDMWEDELRRRYNPTAFMPLDPSIILNDGKLKVIRQLATGGLSAIYL